MSSDSTKALTIMLMMTTWNMIMAVAMLAGLHVGWGMPIAFLGMAGFVVLAWYTLTPGQYPWRKP